MSTSPGWPSMPAPDVPRRTRRGWLILALLTVVVVGAGAAWWLDRGAPVVASANGTMAAVDDSLARAPNDSRVRVRVLNSSGTRGYARRATLELRDRGFDVVEYETERGKPRNGTLIVSHTGHGDWADRLRRAVGTGSIEARPDSLRYVDLTIFVGRDWKPSSETLRP
ncbi:LytR C-terminal domain-containing protein [Gemmatimonas groenlandica]|uniref:LytR C-terminal domain-containing protein n=1 Tax=Gemmatimonas groenlandica TaxID=2732249 RepID=A0A6M4IQ69_9BACT|nr:LytR C-terminal domain-containing protein [Gemmatimonas groenlandica]QJR34992.1 LytR C-terminal domain-containing protein [Gemmatimonas groenlandica]